jgi:hypothetical protein
MTEHPEGEIDMNRIRGLAEYVKKYNRSPARIKTVYGTNRSLLRRFSLAAALMVLAFIALVPFNFRDKVGYEIAISGVDRTIMLDNRGFVPLLDALGMEPGKADMLLDSLEKKEIHLTVGECSETCHMKISDLKTERDVELIIEAIVELGCCEIDNVFPIYREHPTSLLKRATQKLFS